MRSRTYYIDAAVIFACFTAFALIACPDGCVQLILLFIIGMSLLLLTSGKLLYAAEILIPAVTLFLPETMLFIPAVIYSSLVNCHRLPTAVSVFFLAAELTKNGLSPELTFSVLVSLLAAVLALRSGELIRLRDELKKTRDNDTELTLMLKQKNRDLMQRQDDEVNIATLRERNRIAREIHDNVGHLLSRALLQSGALLAVMNEEKLPAQYTIAAGVKETLDSAMNTIRESVHGLHDESIDLHHEVREIADSVSGKLTVRTDLDFSETMPANVKMCFIAVVKEAVSNSLKYSTGSEINIVIREHPAIYQLFINDNGTSLKRGNTGGMGLNNMRERTEALGGIFQLDTKNGFRIFISIRRRGENSDENNNGR